MWQDSPSETLLCEQVRCKSEAALQTLSGSLAVCRMEWWDSCGYRSLCLPSDDGEEDQDEEEDVGSIFSVDSDRTDIHYILGDVTHPHTAQQDAIIVHCVGKCPLQVCAF